MSVCSLCRVLVGGLISILGASGAVFEVGPGRPLATPSEVPWESLEAGDVVRIHWRSEPYRDKWVLCRAGTEAAPIRVEGVVGPAGQRPVVDGREATTRTQLNYWNQPRGVVKIGGANVPPDTTPRHLVVENLEIRSARPPYGFTAADGSAQSYPNNAAALFVEKGEYLTIRNCVFHDSGNGLFVAYQAREVLVEGCWLHDNGNEGSAYEHNSYTAAQRITFQYNRYGPLRAGCLGNNLKDRSAGLVVRYNWIEGGNRQLDLVDGEDSPVIQNHPDYHRTWVYGNILIEPEGAGNRQIVHYGGDSGNPEFYRKGMLYFHHNTVVSTRTDRTTLFRFSTNEEQCDCRNNVVYAAAGGNTLSAVDSAGGLRLAHNWFSAGWVGSFSTVTGTITDAGGNLAGSSPGFLDATAQDFRLTADSACLDAGAPLAPEAVEHQPTRHYRPHQTSAARRRDAVPDLGALEFSPYAAWRRIHFGPGFEEALLAADDADPDADGLVNILEYAYLSDPQDPASAGRTTGTRLWLDGLGYFAVAFPHRAAPGEVRYQVQASEFLPAWSDGSLLADQGAIPVTLLTSDTGSLQPAVVRFNRSLADQSSGFLRVVVSRD